MNITITGSLGNIGQRLTATLVQKGHQVTVVSHSPERTSAIEQLGAIPAIGLVADHDFLLQAFKNADAVFLMIPPDFQATDIPAYIKRMGDNYAKAIAETGVRYVVNLSSIGSHIPDGPGPTGANYYVEQQLSALPDVHVLHLRPGLFYTNYFGSIPMIRQQHILGHIFDAAVNIVFSHPHDIAAVAADALDTLSFTDNSIQYVVSDVKNGGEVAAILGNAIGQPDLAWVNFPDAALLQGLVQNGMSEQMATVYIIEMGRAIREGVLFEDYEKHRQEARGKTSFEEFTVEFAAVYKQ